MTQIKIPKVRFTTNKDIKMFINKKSEDFESLVKLFGRQCYIFISPCNDKIDLENSKTDLETFFNEKIMRFFNDASKETIFSNSLEKYLEYNTNTRILKKIGAEVKKVEPNVLFPEESIRFDFTKNMFGEKVNFVPDFSTASNCNQVHSRFHGKCLGRIEDGLGKNDKAECLASLFVDEKINVKIRVFSIFVYRENTCYLTLEKFYVETMVNLYANQTFSFDRTLCQKKCWEEIEQDGIMTDIKIDREFWSLKIQTPIPQLIDQLAKLPPANKPIYIS